MTALDDALADPPDLPPATRATDLVLAPEAFHGLAGDVVGMYRPHTEAADAAILVDFLTSFGNAVGAGPFAFADGAKHHARLDVVIVGPTSRARKGSSRQNVAWLMRSADEEWSRERVASGLSSGEGLIQALTPPVDNDGNPTTSDKRLLLIESEFARVLKVAGRDGSIVSQVLRQAWDGGELRVLTRGNPLRVDGAHISVIGHITLDELRRHLSEGEAANGFGNRHLWLWAARSKRLPRGGDLDDQEVATMGSRVYAALTEARKRSLMKRTPAAEAEWERIYMAIVDDTPGMVGAMIARVEAQLLRLSLTYALLDGSKSIDLSHLAAACAVWDYSAATVAKVFTDATGDPLADKLLEAITISGGAGLTRAELSAAASRHASAARLNEALDLLTSLNQVETVTVETGGRPATITRLCSAKQAKKAQKVPGTPDEHGLLALLSLPSQPDTGEAR